MASAPPPPLDLTQQNLKGLRRCYYVSGAGALAWWEGTALLSAIIRELWKSLQNVRSDLCAKCSHRELDLGRILRFCHSLQIDPISD